MTPIGQRDDVLCRVDIDVDRAHGSFAASWRAHTRRDLFCGLGVCPLEETTRRFEAGGAHRLRVTVELHVRYAHLPSALDRLFRHLLSLLRPRCRNCRRLSEWCRLTRLAVNREDRLAFPDETSTWAVDADLRVDVLRARLACREQSMVPILEVKASFAGVVVHLDRWQRAARNRALWGHGACRNLLNLFRRRPSVRLVQSSHVSR